MKRLISALGCGLLFGIGLCLSGMTDPTNIIAFLDVSGKWSPNLAGVMLGAIAVHAAWLRWLARREEASAREATTATDSAARQGAVVTTASAAPASGKRIDGALVGGAALFGIGWGASGYCPGPAIVALASGALGAVVFVAAMAAGMILSERGGSMLERSDKRQIAVL